MKRTDMTDPHLSLFLSSSTGAFLNLPHHPALWTQGSSSFFCALDLWLVCLSVIMIQIIYRDIRQLMATAFPSEEVGELLSAPPCCWELPSVCTLHAAAGRVSGWGTASFSKSTVPITHTASSHSSGGWGEDTTRKDPKTWIQGQWLQSLDHQGLVRIFFTNKPNARYILSTSPPFPSHLRHYLDSLQKLKLHSKCCLLQKDLN